MLLSSNVTSHNREWVLLKKAAVVTPIVVVVDLLAALFWSTGFLWYDNWPMLWFLWTCFVHLVLGWTWMQVAAALVALSPVVPARFSRFRPAMCVVLLVSLVDWFLGGWLLWSKNWVFPSLLSAPSLVFEVVELAPRWLLWAFRIFCSFRLLLTVLPSVLDQPTEAHCLVIMQTLGTAAKTVPTLTAFLAFGLAIVFSVVDILLLGFEGWVWRSRGVSSYQYIAVTILWGHFGHYLPPSKGVIGAWIQFNVFFVLLGPASLGWTSCIYVAHAMFLAVLCLREIIYSTSVVTLLGSTRSGRSLISFAEGLEKETNE